MSQNTTLTNREKIIQLIENLSDANVQRILIYIQGLQAGQNLKGRREEHARATSL